MRIAVVGGSLAGLFTATLLAQDGTTSRSTSDRSMSWADAAPASTASAKHSRSQGLPDRALSSARPTVDVALLSTERQQLDYGNALYEYGLALGNRWLRERRID